MAKRPKKEEKGPSVDRKACERVMFGLGHARRFTQDSPILPDVWLKFAEDLDATCELLLTPFGESRAGEVREAVYDRLQAEGKADDPDRELIYNQSTVLAKLTFEELVRIVLPITDWWRHVLWQRVRNPRSKTIERAPVSPEDLHKSKKQGEIADALRDPERQASKIGLSPDLLWTFRIVGFLALAKKERRDRTVAEIDAIDTKDKGKGETTQTREAKPSWLPEVQAVAELLDGVVPPRPDGPRIWTVNLNRRATTTIFRSSVAVKADAARRLFEISCKDLVWAIVDSGIDATHPAFRLRQDKADKQGLYPLYPKPFEQVEGKWVNRTRVVATYDFRLIRQLLNPARLDPPSLDLPLRVRRLLAGKGKDEKLLAQLKQLKPRLISGNEIDWTLLEPLLEVPNDKRYLTEALGKDKDNDQRVGHIPRNDHGTHCAGILGADWRSSDEGRENQPTMSGICPDIRFYDLRVFDDDGMGDEFSIIAALQYIRFKNAHKDYFVVHGANLSMSIKHDVMNFACGRTPVCEEAERLVNNGVVVAAAAGNEGYVTYLTPEGTTEGYRSISITDPGNADLVITVGATHRFKPHTYGVSYFSSRGPTGDGRIKPDIVAPGEKIESPVPNADSARKDGTSMATPHVSGAAALLMARYEELIGRPRRIKEILTATATDLGREHYFQGAGMVDILRALQSV